MHFHVPYVRYLGLLLAILLHGSFDASLTFTSDPPQLRDHCHSARVYTVKQLDLT